MAESFKYATKLADAPLVQAELTADGDKSDLLEVQDWDFQVAVWADPSFIGIVTIDMRVLWRDVTSQWIAMDTFTTSGFKAYPQMKGRVQVRATASSWSGGTARVLLYRGEPNTQRTVVTRAVNDG